MVRGGHHGGATTSTINGVAPFHPPLLHTAAVAVTSMPIGSSKWFRFRRLQTVSANRKHGRRMWTELLTIPIVVKQALSYAV